MKKTILAYGLVGGALIAVLNMVEYRFLIVEHSVEIYAALVALVFASVGIWLGNRLNSGKPVIVFRDVHIPVPVVRTEPFVRNDASVARLGITPRELEILEAIAAGLSTREIGEKLFVSENTVKTHSSRLFEKLDAKRRTQAVQLAQQAGILP